MNNFWTPPHLSHGLLGLPALDAPCSRMTSQRTLAKNSWLTEWEAITWVKNWMALDSIRYLSSAPIIWSTNDVKLISCWPLIRTCALRLSPSFHDTTFWRCRWQCEDKVWRKHSINDTRQSSHHLLTVQMAAWGQSVKETHSINDTRQGSHHLLTVQWQCEDRVWRKHSINDTRQSSHHLLTVQMAAWGQSVKETHSINDTRQSSHHLLMVQMAVWGQSVKETQYKWHQTRAHTTFWRCRWQREDRVWRKHTV